MKTYEFDPLANIFPLMEGAEHDALVADVKANGLHEPIWIYADKILDGRNRYLAYLAAGFTDDISVREYTGDDPAGFVVSMNLKRRHLNESQRAMVAAKLAALQDGQRQVGQLADVPTQEEAARLLNVGERSVRRAKAVRDQGEPELIAAVESGTVAVSAAAAVARLPKERQREAVAGGRRRVAAAAKVKTKAKPTNSTKTAPALSSLSWVEATPSARTKFLDAIGYRDFVDACPAAWREALARDFGAPRDVTSEPGHFDLDLKAKVLN